MNRARSAFLVFALVALAWGGSPAVAQSALALTRVELLFQNGRGDITIPLRYPDLRAYAILRFDGSGILQATWKVDGRILSTVAEPTVFGEMLILATPRTPPLPTFEPGLHRVALEITAPKPAFKIPEITYFVTAEEYEEFKKRMEKGP
jgi:hypothetical protein